MTLMVVAADPEVRQSPSPWLAVRVTSKLPVGQVLAEQLTVTSTCTLAPAPTQKQQQQ
jgi:hypothetical protein